MCKDVQGSFTDIVFTLDDEKGYIVPPVNYLMDLKMYDKDLKKEVNHCVILIQRNNIPNMQNEYVLGTVFLYSYYQLYDFENNKIGFNGDYIDFNPNRKNPLDPDEKKPE